MKKKIDDKAVKTTHETVMLEEAVDGLQLKKNGSAIDATVGMGGHAERMARALGPKGKLLVIDADEASLEASRKRLEGAPGKILFVRGNFRNLKKFAEEAKLSDVVGVLFDLGWHAGQLQSGRGLSFKADEPLDMRLSSGEELTADVEREKREPLRSHFRAEDGKKRRDSFASRPLTAKDIIADWDEGEIARLIREYGEERFAGRIARNIVEAREKHPIETSRELSDIISAAVPAFYRRGRIHPATRTFQALRIAVNDELGALTEALEAAINLVAEGGRVAAISFHSLEDRIVKRAFRAAEDRGTGERITKKPLTPGDEERMANPRARSAKLRVFEKKHDTP